MMDIFFSTLICFCIVLGFLYVWIGITFSACSPVFGLFCGGGLVWLFVLFGCLVALLVGRLDAWLGLGLGLGLTQLTLDPTCTNTTPKKLTLLQRPVRHQQYLPHRIHLTDN